MDMAECKFQTFYPGNYTPQEEKLLHDLMDRVETQGGVGPMANRTIEVTEHAMLDYAELWNRYDPLYNDPDYARSSRWGKLPALPCFVFDENISGFPMMDDVKDALGNVFYYANDGGDIELYRQVYPGDVITITSGTQRITDVTPEEGSILRQFSLYGEGEMRNQRGELVGVGKGYGRNAWKRICEGRIPSQIEQTYEWLENIPPVHTTTPEEWAAIKALWKQEKIRGCETLYWEDVCVGDRPTPCCSGPISDMDMMRLHGNMIRGMPDNRTMVEAGEHMMMTDAYGQKINMMSRHFSYCRIPSARAVFFNFTARNFVLRMVSNWMGDDGFITGIKWRFQNLFSCMSQNQPGLSILGKVPSMAGKYVNRHGMEGDTAICKGEVTAKYVKEGRHLADLSCWAETLDGDVIQVVEVTVELPTRHG